MSYYDKRKLVEKGHLKDNNRFELATNTSYLPRLKSKDCASIQTFAARNQNLRGRELIRKMYLEYPKYASRSSIADKVLTFKEKKIVQMAWNDNLTPTLFTIGYEGKTIDDYLRCLIFNNIHVLIDVRRNPFSRKHGFSKNGLQRYLEKVGIQYLHIPKLGIASHLRKNLNDKSSYDILFEQYATNVLPEQTEALYEIWGLLKKHKRIALTCFEADPSMCHRHKVTEALEAEIEFNYAINHI